MADPRLAVLAEAQRLGLLGPGPLPPVVAHAERYLTVLPSPLERLLDLGSGGGVPGLVLALALPATTVTLLDGSERCASFLRRAVGRLARSTGDADLVDRVRVLGRRAEEAAHDPSERARYDAVVARAFGPPEVTAECASGFLRVGGLLVVSEPPVPRTWDLAMLGVLGLAPRPSTDVGLACFAQVSACPAHLPRHRPGRGRPSR